MSSKKSEPDNQITVSLTAGNTPMENPVAESDDPVAKAIALYRQYKIAMHGRDPAWLLPDLDSNVKLSFPNL